MTTELQAVRLLRVGGTLVYSTCTLMPEENEHAVAHVLRQFGDSIILEDASTDQVCKLINCMVTFQSHNYRGVNCRQGRTRLSIHAAMNKASIKLTLQL